MGAKQARDGAKDNAAPIRLAKNVNDTAKCLLQQA